MNFYKMFIVTYGCFNYDNSFLSFMTEFTDFLFTILTFDISFIAYKVLNFLLSTFQTYNCTIRYNCYINQYK